MFQTVSGRRVLSEAGVSSSQPAQHLVTYIDAIGNTQSGIALCNPNQTAVTVTLKLRDASGRQIAARSFDLAPFGHAAKFITDPAWFSDAFTGLEGSLEVLATAPICASALRYDNPQLNVFATLPMIVIH